MKRVVRNGKREREWKSYVQGKSCIQSKSSQFSRKAESSGTLSVEFVGQRNSISEESTKNIREL